LAALAARAYPAALADYVGGRSCWFLGDGCEAFREYEEERGHFHFQVAPEQALHPQVENLLRLAMKKWENQDYVQDYARLKPVYLRLSEAEARLAERRKSD
jgi:hypothetical protein